MSVRSPFFFAACVAALLLSQLATAAPECKDKDSVGCSHDSTQGWIAGSGTNNQPRVAQEPKADLAAQAARDRQAYDAMIARMATEQERARVARLPGELAAIAAGNTPDLYRSFVLAKGACLDSNMTIGCGHYAQLMKQQPTMECRERHERTGTFEGCPTWGPPPAEIVGWARQGCARGDQYACGMVDALMGVAPAKATATGQVARVDAGGGVGVAVAPVPPAATSGTATGPSLPVVDEAAYRAFKAIEDRCFAERSTKDCVAAAKLTLDEPDLRCRAQMERKFQTACHSKLSGAENYASLGCQFSDKGEKDGGEACALSKQLIEQQKQAGEL